MIIRCFAPVAACLAILAVPAAAPAQGRADLLKAAQGGRASALIAAIEAVSADRAQDRRAEGLAVYLWAGYGLEAVALSPNAWGALARCLVSGVPRACNAPGAAAHGRAMLAAMTSDEPLGKAAKRLATAVGPAPQTAPAAVEADVGFPLAVGAPEARGLDLQLTAMFGPSAGPAPAAVDCAGLAGNIRGAAATAPLTRRGFSVEAAEGWRMASPGNYDAIAAIRRECPALAPQFTRAAMEPKVRAAVTRAPGEVCAQTTALQARFADWEEMLRLSRSSPALDEQAAAAPVYAEMQELLSATCPDPSAARQAQARIRGYAVRLAAARESGRCAVAARRLMHVDAVASTLADFEGATSHAPLAPAIAAVEEACAGQEQVLQPLGGLLSSTRFALARNIPACRQALGAVDAAGAAFDAAVTARNRAGAEAAHRTLESAWKAPQAACSSAARDIQAMGEQRLRQGRDILSRM